MKHKKIGFIIIGFTFLILCSIWLLGTKEAVSSSESADIITEEISAPARIYYSRHHLKKMKLKLADGGDHVESVNADPLLVALSGPASRSGHFVIEISAIRQTPVGQMIEECLTKSEKSPLKKFEKKSGKPFLDVVERIAITNEMMIFQGDFSNTTNKNLMGYGKYRTTEDENATLFHREFDFELDTNAKPSVENAKGALYDNSLLMIAQRGRGMDEVLGLLNGTVPYDENVYAKDNAYGEVHGRLGVDEASKMFRDFKPFVELMLDDVEDIYFNLDAKKDVTFSAEIVGFESNKTSELATHLDDILSNLEDKAKLDGEDGLAQLLSYSSIDNADNGFTTQFDLPFEFVQNYLSDCQWVDKL